MTFLLTADGRTDVVTGAFERYRKYLQASKHRFPPNAYALAMSDWYFDFTDHRCPHDTRVEQLTVSEAPDPQQPSQRLVSLNLRLIGAYHDGHIELRYEGVRSYSLGLVSSSHGHRDWRYDELRGTDDGYVIHEIEWWGPSEVGRWLIEASDARFEWLPIPPP